MRIIVDGKEAVLKAGSSFEYISENPLFTEAEGYSLEIEFPLKDCPENILIFGALHVQGVDLSRITFPCELDAGTFRKTGILTITAVSEVEVKGQFLEGMSQQNFANSLPDVYLTDLDFSAYDGTAETAASVAQVEGAGWDKLVVWDSAKEQPIYAVDSVAGWGSLRHRHIYLYRLVEIVAALCNYSVDASKLESIPMYKKILVVNCVDGIVDRGGNYGYYPLQRALPHWTVKQFFQEVGNFFGCIVELDSSARKVSFVTCSSIMSSSASMQSIQPLDDFEVEISEEEDKYRGNTGFKLPDDCNPDNLNMCPWLLDKTYLYYITNKTASQFRGILSGASSGGSSNVQELFYGGKTIYYITDKGCYAIVTNKEEYFAGEHEEGDVPDAIFGEYEVINQFGNFTEGEELGIAPCPITIKKMWVRPTINGERDYSTQPGDMTTHYKMPVLELLRDQYIDFRNNDGVPVNDTLEVLKGGEQKETEYYDKLWVVLHSGTMNKYGYHVNTRKFEPEGRDQYLATIVQAYEGEPPLYDYTVHEYDYTLSPADSTIKSYSSLPKVDETQLYRYKFLGTTIPSPTSVFLINGQKFACLRITAHFTPSGMSELLEGEFYRIID